MRKRRRLPLSALAKPASAEMGLLPEQIGILRAFRALPLDQQKQIVVDALAGGQQDIGAEDIPGGVEEVPDFEASPGGQITDEEPDQPWTPNGAGLSESVS